MTHRLLLAVLLVCASACGNSGQGGGGVGDSGAPPDGSPPAADGPFACGTSTCTATQYCVQACTCGGVQLCTPLGDAATCPAGQQLQPAGNCCITPCSNPPPACQDMPSCGGVTSSRNVQCPCPG